MNRTGTSAGAVPLGRIAGIPVSAHWSVLGIIALIAFVMARTELPLLAPGHGPVAYAVAGVVVALLLMLSLLAHEAAHALVARAHGLGVEDITLWLLGGTTRLVGDPDRPGAEFRIAVVGPLVSGLLAGGFALGAGLASTGGLVSGVLVELAVVNLVLAVFNLLPAAPLDGGRVLRAALWALRGDRWAASVAAARVGQVLSVLLVAGGVLLAVAVDLGGLWLAIIGWFIGAAASVEERRARQGRALEGLPVTAAAAPAPPVLAEDVAPAELTATTATPGARTAGILLVDVLGHPSGYVPPERLRAARTSWDDPAERRRVVVPAARLVTVRPGDPLSPLLGRLTDPGSRLVVMDAGTTVGVVSPADVEDLLARRGALPGRRTAPPRTAGPAPRDVPDADAPPPEDWWWHGGPGPATTPPRTG